MLCLFFAATLSLSGYTAVRGVNASGPAPWTEHGFGRLESGADRNDLFAVAQVGGDWTPSQYFDVHASGVARREPSDFGGRRAGLIDAYADVRAVFSRDQIQLRAGQFFLPSSRENKGDLWTSPYTINFSALNSWIGEEFRPIGADLEWRHTTAVGNILTVAGTAFRGNDTMGALLAWRGWSVGNRLSVYNEVLPLPPLGSLPEYFPMQRGAGTKAFGSDLDHRTGFAGRVRYSLPERANIQWAHVDNRADRALYGSDYAWDTRFDVVSAELGNSDRAIVAAETMRGHSGMGFPANEGFVQMDFRASYVLLSQKLGRGRWSARYDWFGTTERDFSAAESNEESGRSWTFTGMYDIHPHVRAALEFTQVTGNRLAAAESGHDPNLDGRSVTAELRYRF